MLCPPARTPFHLFITALTCMVAAVCAAEPPSAVARFTDADTLEVVGLAEGAGPYRGGTSSVTRIDLDHAAGGGDLAELLADAAGLQLHRYGGLGAPVMPSLRGSSATQVTVLIDGIPQNDAQGGVIDLSRLPLARFASAEIHRGGLPARLGGTAGAGAVNLVTRRDENGVAGILLSGGSFGAAGLRIVDGRRLGAVDALFMAHGRRVDNLYGFLDHNQTFANAADDRPAQRRNAWFRESGASLLLGREALQGADLRLSLATYNQTAGVPGPVGGYESHDARSEFVRHELHATAGAATRWSVDLSIRRETERLDDPLAEVGWDPPGTTRGRSDHLDLRGWWFVSGSLPAAAGWWELQPSVSWRRQTYAWRHEDLVDPLRRRVSTSYGFDALLSLPAPRLSCRLSLVRQRHRDDFPPLPPLPWWPVDESTEPNVHRNWAPAAVATWSAKPGTLDIEARMSRGQRAPTWIELFGHRAGLVGNRGLVPETVSTREIALRLQARDGPRVRLALFRNTVSRAIIWRTTSQYQSTATNVGAAVTTGAELEFTAPLASSTNIWASVTTQDPRDRGEDPVYAGRRLPHQPDWSAAMGVTWRHRGWQLRGKLLREAASHRDRYNDPVDTVPAHTILNLGLARSWPAASWAVGRDLRLTCEGVNLTDNDVYDVAGYPLPGRSYRVSLHIH